MSRLIDLMEKSLAFFTEKGEEKVYTYFMISEGINDYTHFTKKGANEMAKLVAKGIKEARPAIDRIDHQRKVKI